MHEYEYTKTNQRLFILIFYLHLSLVVWFLLFQDDNGKGLINSFYDYKAGVPTKVVCLYTAKETSKRRKKRK